MFEVSYCFHSNILCQLQKYCWVKEMLDSPISHLTLSEKHQQQLYSPLLLRFLLRWSPRARSPQPTCKPSHEFQNLVDYDHGQCHRQNQEPFVQRQRDDAKDLGEEWHIQNQEMQAERNRHGEEEPRVNPRGHCQQASILGEGIEGIEHLYGYQDGERQGRCFDLAWAEVIAWIRIKAEDFIPSCEGRHRKPVPRWALTPVSELRVRDQTVAISRQVDA